MLCKNCGSQINDGLKFCPNCGKAIESDNVIQSTSVSNGVTPDIFNSVNNNVSNSEPVPPVGASPVNEPVAPVPPVGASPVSEPVAPVPPVGASPVNEQVAPVPPVGASPVNEPVAPVPPVGASPVPDFNNPVPNFPEPESATKDVEPSVKKKKSGGGKIIIILLLLILIGAGVGVYFYLFKNDKMIVSNVINNVYKELDKIVVESPTLDYNKDTLSVDGDLTINTNIPEFDVLNSEKLSYSYGLDFQNKKLYSGVSLSEDDVKLFDLMFYILNDKSYILFKNINRLVRIDADLDTFDTDEVEKIDISKDDVRYVIKTYKDIIIESIDKNDLVKSSKTISLSGKDVNVNSLSYTLDKNNYEKFVTSIIDNSLNNNKLLEILAKMSNTEVSEIKKSLEDSKSSSSFDDFDSKIVFDIFTKGFTNTYVGMDINFDDEMIVQIRDNGNDTNVIVLFEGYTLNLVIKNSNYDSYDIDFEFKYEEKGVNGNISTSSNRISDNKIENSFSFKLNNSNNKNFNITTKYVQVIGENIEGIDVSDAVDIDSLTNEDMEEILSKFIDSKLYELIGSFYGDLNTNNEENYLDYDSFYSENYDSYDFNNDVWLRQSHFLALS